MSITFTDERFYDALVAENGGRAPGVLSPKEEASLKAKGRAKGRAQAKAEAAAEISPKKTRARRASISARSRESH